jgi:glyoxylate carboligase
MQYGSIGWSVGATLGYAQAVPNKRVIACIGDGSFQVSRNLKVYFFIFFIFYSVLDVSIC